ncbi:Elongin-C [Seminavis robusta]|uniref:Elongin-C n=1 Tax=Seminavis robusta TaxID=568900 RepID=A0A9N8DH81_9STRA|nr:Elongin-C [Seminavis robusta]|eukprot:Sro89_g047040.1 Elongin-C (105) ;mRNA; f:91505-92012
MDAETPNTTQFVKLVSAEGSEFYIDRNVAVSASKTLRTMLEGQFREAKDNVIRLPEISNYILERILQYLYYQTKYSNSTGRVPEFPIEPEIALELLIASKYLDC